MNKQIMSQLDYAVKNNKNVLLIGEAGVGKTSIIKSIFEQNGLNYKYFSASTMDPWVDFVGVPKEVQDENGTKFLDLIRPEAFAKDQVEALFFDEYNRANDKVRNATMELIQFKSINGKKYNKLKIVWAAINPYTEEEEYNVEKLDPAQLDRFDFHIEIPYKVNKLYFMQKYPKNAESAIEWWNGLPEAQKKIVSPRRLDGALEVFENSGDIGWVLPKTVNIKDLVSRLKYGSLAKRILEAFNKKDEKEAKTLINDSNVLSNDLNEFIKNDDYMDFFFKYITDERLTSIMKNQKVFDYILKNAEQRKDLLQAIVKTKALKRADLVKINAVLASSQSEVITDVKLRGFIRYAQGLLAQSSVVYNRNKFIERLRNDLYVGRIIEEKFLSANYAEIFKIIEACMAVFKHLDEKCKASFIKIYVRFCESDEFSKNMQFKGSIIARTFGDDSVKDFFLNTTEKFAFNPVDMLRNPVQAQQPTSI